MHPVSTKSTKHSRRICLATEPNVQDSFIWPHFIISRTILTDLDFEDTVSVQLHRPSLGTWVRIREGHTISVGSQSRIFLKSTGVTQAHGFDQNLKRLALLHFNLKGFLGF
jgi:hypothetical protein